MINPSQPPPTENPEAANLPFLHAQCVEREHHPQLGATIEI